MKILHWFIPFAVLMLLLSVGAIAVSGAGTSPVGAPYVDNGLHVAGADATDWYRFEYPGNHSQVTIRLVDVDEGMGFEVYPPTLMDEWWKHDGIGAGSVQGNDLIWTGNAHEAGTWYIKVLNNNPAPTSYRLLVTGSDVAFSPAVASITSLSPTTPSLENVDPNNAFLADATARVIPANTTLWYRYFYPGDHSQMNIVLPKGSENKLSFNVHAPSQMSTWWNDTPIGRGNVSGDDLKWSGNSHEGGWWYVEVANDRDTATAFNLDVTGDKVWMTNPTDSAATPPTVPSITPTLANADPNKALVVNEDLHTIPGTTTLWYRFAYPGKNDQTILTVPDGNKNGLRVHIHTPEEMKNWWNATPIGQATPKGDDLVWNGGSPENGWWYIEVINENTTPENYQLLLQTQERY